MNRMPQSWALLLAALAAGCSGESVPARPIVSVQRFDVEKACYSTCPEITPPAAELSLGESTCGTAAACGFVGGLDRLRVIVDYGAIEIDENVAPPKPTVTLIEDGVESAAPSSPIEWRQSNGRIVFISSFIAPPRRVDGLAIRAKVVDGFVGMVERLSIDALDFDFDIVQCSDDMQCDPIPADVGRLGVNVTAPMGTDSPTALLSSRLEGLPQLETTNVVLEPAQGGKTLEGYGSLSVPAGRENDLWTIEVTLSKTTKTANLRLGSPNIEISVPACPKPMNGETPICTAKAGETIKVVVAAPFDMHQAQASLTYELNEVPSSGEPQAEDFVVESPDRKSAIFAVPVPNIVGAKWQLIGRVGKYKTAAAPIYIE